MDAAHPSSGTSRWHRPALIAAAVIPFLLSAGFHLAGPKARPPLPREARPALAFDQYLVDLGPVGAQPHVFASFSFQNRGEHPLTITDVEPSCGCITPELAKRDYAAGEGGRIFLKVQTTRETPGQKEYFVKLRYEDPQPREVDVTFRFDLPERQVHVEPAALIFYQNGTEPTTQDVIVSDYRTRPLRLRDAVSSSELVSARIEEITDAPDGLRRSVVKVTAAATVPPGKHRAVVSLLSDDPAYREIQVPLIIQSSASVPAHVDAAVRVAPELLVLEPTRSAPAEGVITVTDSREKSLRPLRVTSTSPAVSAELAGVETDTAGHKSWRILAKASAGLPPGLFRSVINIRTDDPARPELQVPVQVHVPEPNGSAESRTSSAGERSAN